MPNEEIRRAVRARGRVLDVARWAHRQVHLPPRHGIQGDLPVALGRGELDAAFADLGAEGLVGDLATVRRWTLYGLLRTGFAWPPLEPRLREVKHEGEQVGDRLHAWMVEELRVYRLEPIWFRHLVPAAAAEHAIELIRRILAEQGESACEGQNLDLESCRGLYPSDSDYLTRITSAGDFPRTIDQLALVYDPRNWAANDFADFVACYPVTDVDGLTTTTHDAAMGESWNGIVLEHVVGPDDVFMKNTLHVVFHAHAEGIALTYRLGKTVDTNGPAVLERDFGSLEVKPLAAPSSWSHIQVEKYVRFSGTPGASGGDIGWGNLANLIAPAVVGSWLGSMYRMPCWKPPPG